MVGDARPESFRGASVPPLVEAGMNSRAAAPTARPAPAPGWPPVSSSLEAEARSPLRGHEGRRECPGRPQRARPARLALLPWPAAGWRRGRGDRELVHRGEGFDTAGGSEHGVLLAGQLEALLGGAHLEVDSEGVERLKKV